MICKDFRPTLESLFLSLVLRSLDVWVKEEGDGLCV